MPTHWASWHFSNAEKREEGVHLSILDVVYEFLDATCPQAHKDENFYNVCAEPDDKDFKKIQSIEKIHDSKSITIRESGCNCS